MKKFFVAIIILFLGLTIISCAPTPTARVAPPAAKTGYAHPEALIDTDWVAAHLTDPQVRLMDVSSKREVYGQGHLPGAVYVNLTTDLLNPLGAPNGQTPTQVQLESRLGQLGIRRETTIALYDDMQSLYAARAFWLLKYYDHPNVAILNGGSQQWNLEKRPMTKEVPTFAAATYLAGGVNAEIRVTSEHILPRLQKPGIALLDARTSEEFNGEQVRSTRGGHIPGAVNVEWSKAMKSDGTFRPPDELNRLYQRTGVSRDAQVFTYCQTGTRGAHTWFVLKYLLGFTNVSLYEGSWQEWGNRNDLPISVVALTPQASPTALPEPCE